MSTPLIVNGVTFDYPETGDNSWGPDATDWASAVTTGMLQKAGGSFTLTAEVDFGATYGLKSAYFKSRAANPSASGVLRLGNNQSLGWRDQGNSADILITLNASDQFAVGSTMIPIANDTHDLGITGTRWRDFYLSGDADIAGNVTIGGTLSSGAYTVTNLTATGNTVLGDTDSDTIDIVAEFISDLIPDVTNTVDLGSTGQRWKDLWLSGNGTIAGNLAVTGTLSSGAFTVTDLTATGNTVLGNNAGVDTTTFTSRIASDFVPTASNTYDLGSTALRWKDLWVAGSGTIAGTGSVGGAVSSSVILRIGSSNPLSGTAQIGSQVNMTATSAATSGVESFRGSATTANSSFTAPYLAQFYADTITKGASSTITRHVHFLTAGDADQGANNANLADNLSFTSNWNLNFASTRANTFGGSMTAASFIPSGSSVPTNGLYLSASNTLAFATNSANSGSIASGLWTIGASGSTQTHVINGLTRQTTAGATNSVSLIQQTGTADSYTRWYNGTAGASWGIDQSDSNSFNLNLGTGSTPSDGTPYLKVSTAGLFTIGAAAGTNTHVVNGSVLVSQRMSLTNTAIGTGPIFDTGTGDGGASSTTQIGVRSRFTANSSSTAGVEAFRAAATTADSAFTAAYVAAFYANNAAKGAASTVTRHIMFAADTPTQGTNNATIADNFSFSGSWFINSSSTNPSRLSGRLLVLGTDSSDSNLVMRGNTLASGTTQYGVFARPTFTSGVTAFASAFTGQIITENASFTTSLATAYYAPAASKGASNTITRLVNYYSVEQSAGTNNAHIADNSAFSGNWFINSTTTNSSLITGSINIGASFGDTSPKLFVGGNNASAIADQFGLLIQHVANSSATSTYSGVRSEVRTANSSFTTGLARAFSANAATKGASNTITRLVNYYSTAQSAGTNNAHIADNAAFTGNYFINSTSTDSSLFSGIVNASAGVRTRYVTTNVSNPPTDAELDSAFGAPATLGSGFLGVVNDNGGGTNEYLCWTDGTNWFYVTGTLAA